MKQRVEQDSASGICPARRRSSPKPKVRSLRKPAVTYTYIETYGKVLSTIQSLRCFLVMGIPGFAGHPASHANDAQT